MPPPAIEAPLPPPAIEDVPQAKPGWRVVQKRPERKARTQPKITAGPGPSSSPGPAALPPPVQNVPSWAQWRRTSCVQSFTPSLTYSTSEPPSGSYARPTTRSHIRIASTTRRPLWCVYTSPSRRRGQIKSAKYSPWTTTLTTKSRTIHSSTEVNEHCRGRVSPQLTQSNRTHILISLYLYRTSILAGNRTIDGGSAASYTH